MKFSVAILVAVIAAVAIFLSTLDLERYKPSIAALVENATGRKLSLVGPISLGLFPSPALVLRNVGFANARWGSRQNMAELQELAASVEILPLLHGGPVSIKELRVKGLNLLLETDSDNRNNWTFDALSEKGKASPQQTAASDETDRVEIPTFRNITLENIHLTYRDGVSKQETQFDLRTLTLKDAPSDRLQLAAEALYRGETIKLSAMIGTLDRLFDKDERYPVGATLSAAGAQLTATGWIRSVTHAPDLEFLVAAMSSDLAKLNTMLGVDLPRQKQASLALKVSGNVSRVLTLSGLKLAYGGSGLSGDGRIILDRARPALEAKLAGGLIDLADFVDSKTSAPSVPQKPGANAKRRLFSDEPIELDALSRFDADIAVNLDRLQLDGAILSDVTLRALLADRLLTLSPVEFNAFSGKFTGNARVDTRGALPSYTLDLAGQHIDMNRLLREVANQDILVANAEAGVSLRASGRSLRAIMAALDGRSEVVLGKGLIRNKYAEYLNAGLMDQVMPWADRKNDTVLNCFVDRIDFARGVGQSRVLLADTERMTLVGEGNVDFGTENMSLKITPHAKEVSLAKLAVPFLVNGWLGNPNILPDPVGTVTGVVGAASDIALAPVGLLFPSVKSNEAENPCVKTAARGREAAAPSQSQRRQGGVKGTLKDFGHSIENFFNGTQ